MKYQDILGKEIEFNEEKGFVAGVNPKIGITIKSFDNPNPQNFLYCLDMAVARRLDGDKVAIKRFYNRVRLIRKNNALRWNDIEEERVKEGYPITEVGVPFCPFSK